MADDINRLAGPEPDTASLEPLRQYLQGVPDEFEFRAGLSPEVQARLDELDEAAWKEAPGAQ